MYYRNLTPLKKCLETLHRIAKRVSGNRWV